MGAPSCDTFQTSSNKYSSKPTGALSVVKASINNVEIVHMTSTASKLVEANELLFIATETYQKSSLSYDLSSRDDQDVSTNHDLCEFEDDADEIPGEEALQQESHSVNSAHRKIGGGGADTKKLNQNTTSSPAPVPSSTADYDVQRRLDRSSSA